MNLITLKDDELVVTLKTLAQQERELVTRILHHLEEVDRRKLFLAQGYPSLFEWCIGVLSYSSGAAHRRIQSMRLLRTLPEMESRFESGDLSLSVAAQAQSYFRQEDLRRRENHATAMDVEEKQSVVQELLGVSAREAERKLAVLAPAPPVLELQRPLASGNTLVQFEASPELMEKLMELQTLLSHQIPDGKLGSLLEKVTDLALTKIKGRSAFPTSETSASSHHDHQEAQVPSSRYIPVQVRRAVWERDQGRCTFRDIKSGHVCGTRHRLQLDHLLPYAWGGSHTLENLTLRCGAHNRYSAENMGLKSNAS